MMLLGHLQILILRWSWDLLSYGGLEMYNAMVDFRLIMLGGLEILKPSQDTSSM